MKQCSNCGCQNPENTLFCVKCGKKLGIPLQAQNTSFMSAQKYGRLIVGIITCIVVLVLGSGAFYYLYQNQLLFFASKKTSIKTTIVNDNQINADNNSNEYFEDTTEYDREYDKDQAVQSSNESVVQKPSSKNTEYILPESNSRYLSMNDLQGLTAEQCRIARNELYARYGRMFDDAGLQEYFNSCTWYEGRIPAANFDDSVFNDYEKANRDLIVQYESIQGYR